MSSILDALRRIEREAGERPGLPFELPPENGPPPSRNRRRWIGAASAVAVLGIVAFALLSIDRDGDETSDRASPAPGGNAEVALLAPETPAPVATIEGGSPSAPAPERAANLAPMVAEEPVEPDTTAEVPPLAAGTETADSGFAPTNEPTQPARPADVERTSPTRGESPEAARRAQLHARREAIMAERRHARETQEQGQSERQAQGAGPVGETAGARPWQRVLAAPTEPADAEPVPSAEMGPAAHMSPVPEAGPMPEVGPSPIAPVAKVDTKADTGERIAPAPPLPSARAEPRLPFAEEQAAPERPTAEAREGEESETGEDRGGADTDTVDTEEPAARPTEVTGPAPETAPADAVTETAAAREEEILQRPPRGAPRVRVSFLLYSEDPGRRRVMLTVNDGTDLVTAYEGQRIEAFEIARILPDEVHLRYEGKVFAVQPHY